MATIKGTNGSDSLKGTSSADLIYGYAGNDMIYGGAGVDTMYGGKGNDTYYVDNVNDKIIEYSKDGTDTVISSVSYALGNYLENLTLSGTANLNATGNTLNNYIKGNSGNNIINGKAGADTMEGGDGNDTYYVDNTGDKIIEHASDGEDTVISSITYTLGDNLDNLTLVGTGNINGTGNFFDNYIKGNSGKNVLSAGIGFDTIDGGKGADTMIGGYNNDIYYVDNTGDVVTEYYDEGYDTVISSIAYTLGNNLEALTLTGSSNISGTGNSYDNYIKGNDGKNILKSGAGNDTIDGGAGADTMYGGTGDDIYYVDNIGDSITEYSNGGNNTVNSTISYSLGNYLQNLTLLGSSNINGTGNSYSNNITGNSGKNVLKGGAGDDALNGGAGIDTMYGGTGNDTYFVDNTNDVIKEYSSEGIDSVYSYVSYTLGDNVENLLLLDGDYSEQSSHINATGNSLDNILMGNYGDNILYGGAGNDTITDGGAGVDTLYGGTGNDTYYIENYTPGIVIEYANEGIDTVYSAGSYILPNNVENLYLTDEYWFDGTGNSLNNNISGNIGNNVIDGKAGADTMEGGMGSDTYIVDNTGDVVNEYYNEYYDENDVDLVVSSVSYTLGNYVENLLLSGNNNLSGTGNDLDNAITGNSGNNTLNGGTGSDTLYGGLGNDTYNFNRNSGSDLIGDDGGSDKISFASCVGTDVAFYSNSNDLVFAYGPNNCHLTVQDQNLTGSSIEKVQLYNKTYLTNSEINSVIQQMSAYASSHGIQLTNVNDVKNSQDLMNIIANSWHS